MGFPHVTYETCVSNYTPKQKSLTLLPSPLHESATTHVQHSPSQIGALPNPSLSPPPLSLLTQFSPLPPSPLLFMISTHTVPQAPAVLPSSSPPRGFPEKSPELSLPHFPARIPGPTQIFAVCVASESARGRSTRRFQEYRGARFRPLQGEPNWPGEAPAPRFGILSSSAKRTGGRFVDLRARLERAKK